MLKIMIRVKSVDLFAFCGRDNHPEPADQGQLGMVLSMGHWSEPVEPVYCGSEEGSTEDDLSEDYPGQRISGPDFDTRDREGAEADGPLSFQTLLCKLQNGRTVDLLGHEIEFVSGSHDGDLGYSEVL